MQQQRSQEDSYIHKRLIANINLGPCTETKKNTTQYIYKYVNINMICINTGYSRNYLTIQLLVQLLQCKAFIH